VVRFRVAATVPLAIGVTDAGIKLQVTVAFTGAIRQESATTPLNPFNEVTVIVELPIFPAIAVAEAGDALKPKSFKVKL
jgi:hypothetical protein